jgi:hypothetical protein
VSEKLSERLAHLDWRARSSDLRIVVVCFFAAHSIFRAAADGCAPGGPHDLGGIEIGLFLLSAGFFLWRDNWIVEKTL